MDWSRAPRSTLRENLYLVSTILLSCCVPVITHTCEAYNCYHKYFNKNCKTNYCYCACRIICYHAYLSGMFVSHIHYCTGVEAEQWSSVQFLLPLSMHYHHHQIELIHKRTLFRWLENRGALSFLRRSRLSWDYFDQGFFQPTHWQSDDYQGVLLEYFIHLLWDQNLKLKCIALSTT